MSTSLLVAIEIAGILALLAVGAVLWARRQRAPMLTAALVLLVAGTALHLLGLLGAMRLTPLASVLGIAGCLLLVAQAWQIHRQAREDDPV